MFYINHTVRRLRLYAIMYNIHKINTLRLGVFARNKNSTNYCKNQRQKTESFTNFNNRFLQTPNFKLRTPNSELRTSNFKLPHIKPLRNIIAFFINEIVMYKLIALFVMDIVFFPIVNILLNLTQCIADKV